MSAPERDHAAAGRTLPDAVLDAVWRSLAEAGVEPPFEARVNDFTGPGGKVALADLRSADAEAERRNRAVLRKALAVITERAPAVPVRDHAAAERSQADDLAIDVARLWHKRRVSEVNGLPPGLFAALDQLTAVLLPDGPQDVTR